MNVCVVGLGLIGASICKDLIGKIDNIYGVDINIDTINYALDNKIVNEGSTNLNDFISKSDLIIFSIYPNVLLDELKKYNFRENQVITDVCGVKSTFINEASSLVKPANYCSCHPMAGREKVGIEYAINGMFVGANFLIIKDKDTKDSSINLLKEIGKILKFGKIMVCDSSYHDQMIGFTSTLTHAIACALVNSDKMEDTKYYVGDSYRDLTRIAKINSKLWTELFFSNKENLLNHIINFENELDKIKDALMSNDKNKLDKLFQASSLKREDMEKF